MCHNEVKTSRCRLNYPLIVVTRQIDDGRREELRLISGLCLAVAASRLDGFIRKARPNLKYLCRSAVSARITESQPIQTESLRFTK